MGEKLYSRKEKLGCMYNKLVKRYEGKGVYTERGLTMMTRGGNLPLYMYHFLDHL